MRRLVLFSSKAKIIIVSVDIRSARQKNYAITSQWLINWWCGTKQHSNIMPRFVIIFW